MQQTFIGSGDAFGSGGRMNTCFHVKGAEVDFLIDCGASSLVGLKARHVDLNSIQTIVFTHFHADHFGGLPFFLLDAQFFSKREQPLAIVGPLGLCDWYARVMETAFPGSSATRQRFKLDFHELRARQEIALGGVGIQPFQVSHGNNQGGPFFAYRFEAEGKVISYTGDTEWTDELIPAAVEADLFIAESYFYNKRVQLHLDLASLEQRLPQIRPKRLVLTHMSEDMLKRLDSLPYETAFDGKVVEL